METAKEYLHREYGKKHINILMNMHDVESLFKLMDEYADHKVRQIIYDNELIIKLTKTQSNAEFRRLVLSKLKQTLS